MIQTTQKKVPVLRNQGLIKIYEKYCVEFNSSLAALWSYGFVLT